MPLYALEMSHHLTRHIPAPAMMQKKLLSLSIWPTVNIYTAENTHVFGTDADNCGVEAAVFFRLKTTQLVCRKP